MIRFGMSIICAVTATSALAATKPVHRQDLSDRLGPVVCAGMTSSLPLAAWQAGIYDAQIEGRLLEPLPFQKTDHEYFRRRAQSLAKVRHMGGYASGVCPDGKTGWIAAVPAPEPLTPNGSGSYHNPGGTLKSACASYRMDFAGAKGGRPRMLAALTPEALGKVHQSGTLGVTCQTGKPRWLGPRQWYLAPVGSGPQTQPPGSELLSAGGSIPVNLAAWINHLRRVENLPAVELNSELSERADLLTADKSVTHNRSILEKLSASLSAGNIRFLGENRVRALTDAEMAWLLWNSPRHRELLLDADANAAGIAVRKDGDETLAVIVMARREPLKTAVTGRKGSAAKARK